MRFPDQKFYWLFVCVLAVTFSCRFVSKADAPRRLGVKGASFVIQDSIVLERSADGASINLSFETKDAGSCKLGFYEVSSGSKSTATPTNCSNSSATKFSETISPVPKDKLVAIVLKAWPISGPESAATLMTIPETSPEAGKDSVNLLLVDLSGRRLELTAITSRNSPSSLFPSETEQSTPCALSDARPLGNPLERSSLLIQGATSRGFINAPTTRDSPSMLGGSFQTVQRQSTEWSLSAKTAAGFGQLRIPKPTLLASAIFSGRDQSQGSDDTLEDIDAPAIKVNAGSTIVSTWTLDGDGKNAVAVLTIAPAAGFAGITCIAPASALKISVPGDLVSKIPTSPRLWMTLRLDSWQALEKERWAIRVSDWKSMGIQRL